MLCSTITTIIFFFSKKKKQDSFSFSLSYRFFMDIEKERIPQGIKKYIKKKREIINYTSLSFLFIYIFSSPEG